VTVLISIFLVEWHEEYTLVLNKFNNFCVILEKTFNDLGGRNISKKEFATKAKIYSFAAELFNLYSSPLNATEYLSLLPLNKLENILHKFS